MVLVVVLAMTLTACSTSIKDVKTSSNVGKTVIVKGTVKSSMKLGSLSGYTLEDDSGSIFISTKNLPEEGTTKIVRGKLNKNMLGYYIEK
jgi:aspartyl-tRNA synthetase